jgi:hypothetical protein
VAFSGLFLMSTGSDTVSVKCSVSTTVTSSTTFNVLQGTLKISSVTPTVSFT